VAVAGAIGVAAWLALPDSGGDEDAAAAPVETATATAQVRRLVDREDVEGTLGYARTRTLGAAAAGTLTAMRAEGSAARRGRSLYAVDGKPTAYVLYGRTPAWRAMAAGAEGRDVAQLERNLERLGYDPGTVDDEYDAGTAAAVRDWEEERGATEDGVVSLGEVVFVAGPARIGEHRAEVGDRAGAGRPVLDVSSRRRLVTARLPAGSQGLVERGERVEVTLPDGATVSGRVRRVGRVARTSQDGGESTVALEVAMPSRGVRLDGAPVTVSVARTKARRAVAVPVQALVATAAGEYAVDVGERLGPVEVGAFADGWVEVAGVRAGTRVVVPR
jgi:peptidoglycan hydrolase-like protein with peptidoglycan-binding domain